MATAFAGIVVDASLAVTWFVEEPGTPIADRLVRNAALEGGLWAPELLLLEVTAVLGKRARQGKVASDYPGLSLRRLRRMPIRLIPDAELLDHAVLLSAAVRHPLYDCLYLALAQRLDARLATLDNGLAALARQEDRLWPKT